MSSVSLGGNKNLAVEKLERKRDTGCKASSLAKTCLWHTCCVREREAAKTSSLSPVLSQKSTVKSARGYGSGDLKDLAKKNKSASVGQADFFTGARPVPRGCQALRCTHCVAVANRLSLPCSLARLHHVASRFLSSSPFHADLGQSMRRFSRSASRSIRGTVRGIMRTLDNMGGAVMNAGKKN